MKLGIALLLSLSMEGASAFTLTFSSKSLVKTSAFQRDAGIMYSSTKEDTDSAFSAFADSIEEDNLFTQDDADAVKDSSTWQESLEMFLNPSTPAAKKQILLSDLVNANDNIRADVQTAVRDRKIDNLLTPTGKKLQKGTRAVARQLTTDIFPTIAAANPSTLVPDELPNLVPKIGSRILDAVSNQAKRNFETLQGDLANPSRIPERISKQTADLATEAKNVFLETPEGLVGPSYTVVSEGDGYEIRDYETYTVASTSMSKVGEPYSMDELTKGGAAFNALAAYIFGANDEARIMDMTTPVSTTSVGEMRFYLKNRGASTVAMADFPEPLAPEGSFNEQGAVKVVEVPSARLAVAKFTGFVTEGEVSRQKDALLSSLALDGEEVDTPHGTIVPHVVFQYNPPYTIPIIRRNEIAVPVRVVKENDLESEWQEARGGEEEEEVEKEVEVQDGDGSDDGDDIAPSDVE